MPPVLVQLLAKPAPILHLKLTTPNPTLLTRASRISFPRFLRVTSEKIGPCHHANNRIKNIGITD